MLAVLASGLASSALADYHYYVPEMVDGSTVAHNERARARVVRDLHLGTRLLNVRTTFVLVNTGKTDANVTIAATRDDATARHLTIPGLGSGASLSTKLPPGATRLFVTDGSGDGSPGAAIVTSDSLLNVSEILSNTNSGSVVSESAVPALGDEELATEYMIPVDTAAGVDTGIALYNPGTGSATITLRLLDGAGKAVKSAMLTLAPQAHTTVFATGALLDATPGFRGTLDAASDSRLAVVTVRRSALSPAYTLLPAARQVSGHLQFFLPGIADGRGPSSITQTTFLLTNLSATAATVKLTLRLDSGAPFQVTIPGAGANHAFQATIAAGATLFWQTDGGSASLTSGAAIIASDHPISVAALLSASDTTGAVISETSLGAAPRYFQFVLPFDNAGQTTAAASFYNAGARPVTLTLQLADPDGKPLTSKKLSPLAAGTAVTQTLQDLFPGVPAAKGAITVSTGSPLDILVSAIALRQSTKGAVLSRTPAVTLFRSSGTPTTVTPALDTASPATASIPPTGGSLSLTDAKGNQFALTIPDGAMLDRETITMTAISSATGLSGPGLVAGVQLEPEGLVLLQPALLKIGLAKPPPDGVSPIGWRGQAPGLYVSDQSISHTSFLPSTIPSISFPP